MTKEVRQELVTNNKRPVQWGPQRIVFSSTNGQPQEERYRARRLWLPSASFLAASAFSLIAVASFAESSVSQKVVLCLLASIFSGIGLAIQLLRSKPVMRFQRRVRLTGAGLTIVAPSDANVHPISKISFYDGQAYASSLPFRKRCILIKVRGEGRTFAVGFSEQSRRIWEAALKRSGAKRARPRSPVEPSLVLGGFGVGGLVGCLVCSFGDHIISPGLSFAIIAITPIAGLLIGMVFSGNDLFLDEPMLSCFLITIPSIIVGHISSEIDVTDWHTTFIRTTAFAGGALALWQGLRMVTRMERRRIQEEADYSL